MSALEDKTVNTLRAMSCRRACQSQGAIVARGGIHAARNIECGEEITARDLIICGTSKLAGDVSIGGTLYCPDVYTVNEDIFRPKRNLVPGYLKNPTRPNEKANLGTHNEPWEEAHLGIARIDEICAGEIDSGEIRTKKLDVGSFPRLSVGKNSCGNPLLDVDGAETTINSDLNIANPGTNEVVFCSADGIIDSFVPIYQQWDSFKSTTTEYHPGLVICLTTSYNFIHTGKNEELELECDGDQVPKNTKVKFYFVDGKQLARAKYKLVVTRCGRKFIFKSKNSVKKIKLVFLEGHIYLV